MRWIKLLRRRALDSAIVISHPIQYYAHFYRCLAAEDSLDLHVFFCSDIGARTYYDRDMGTNISWATDLLSGYDYTFLVELSRIHKTGFFSINNPSIIPALERFSPDVVVCDGYAQLTILWTLLYSRFRGIPVLMTSDSELLHYRPPLTRFFKRLGLPILLRQYAAFLTRGDNNEKYLNYYGIDNSKMFRCPHTFDQTIFSSIRIKLDTVKRSFRATRNIQSNSVLFIFIGKLVARKRPHDIIDAAATLFARNSRNSQCILMFAGDGSLRELLEGRAQALGLPCHFLGFINVDIVPSFYAAADVLIHPADQDPHPLSTCEAAYMGLPMIVSDRVGSIGPTDIVRPGENAIVYPSGDVGALADAMERLARDPILRKRMGQASLRIAAELDVRRSVRGVLDAITFVTDRHVAPA